ncbi:MAG: hypothetical protein A4E56_03339 [Pelotomaculum sp. PtaU1.Bin065]|nr:MAG: hypothetical protein A4E56_03339 [Pelotomaculum sp. PtaU1.Bin065]
MSQFDFLTGGENQQTQQNQDSEQKNAIEPKNSEPNTGSIYDPCPDKPGHAEWNQVFYTAFHCDYDIFNVFAYLRYEGIAIKKEQKVERRGRQRSKLTTYSIYRGDVPADRFKAEIVPKYLEPNREGIKKILALAAYNGEFVNLEGLAIKVDKEVVAEALKKYRGRILAARYRDLVQGRELDDGRMVWVVCEREAGSDNTELTWEEFYVLCEAQDRGLLAPGVEGMCKGVRWRE